MLGALRVLQQLVKAINPDHPIVMGGGLSEHRITATLKRPTCVWFIGFICSMMVERPFRNLAEYFDGKREIRRLGANTYFPRGIRKRRTLRTL